MGFRLVIVLILSAQLISCAPQIIKENNVFELAGRDYLYQKTAWSFAGRIAVADENQSLSGSISWVHQKDKESIEISGAFGLGRTRIEITDNTVIIDDGEERKKYIGNVDALISDVLGVRVPISALQFWVQGLAQPKKPYELTEKGFVQSEWQVSYLQMLIIGHNELPGKLKIENDKAKLKLIIDQWQM